MRCLNYFILIVFVLLPLSAHAAPAAKSPPAAASRSSIDILSAKDVATYKEIFQAQKKGNLKQANALINQLDNDLLVGHVLAERYLHPTAYQSTYQELKGWLDQYYDQPQAERIYRLAVNKRPKGAAAPRVPDSLRKKQQAEKKADQGGIVISSYISTKKLNTAQRRLFRQHVARINGYLRKGGPSAAEKVLNLAEVKALADQVEIDTLSARIAAAYLSQKKYRDAWRLADAAARRSGKHFPIGDWTAGIAAWQMKRYDDAGAHFEALADKEGDISDQYASAAAFWAARTHWANKRWDQAEIWLRKAADYPRTFYGILAHRSLGTKPNYDWRTNKLTTADLDALMQSAMAKRGAALLQIGDEQNAQIELRGILSNPNLVPAVATLAQTYHLPNLSVRASRALEKQGKKVSDGALYPTVKWVPNDGFKIDKALFHAISHQESAFNPQAVSHAGATGLMQLMPRTAQYISGGKNFRGENKVKLYDPGYNISLGQKYILYLLAKEDLNGNILQMIASYNGGLGNVRKWRRNYDDSDPLLFIEFIPLSETRDYVKRVAANLWIYQMKFGQPTPTIDVLIDGEWPKYSGQDKKITPNLVRLDNDAADDSEGTAAAAVDMTEPDADETDADN